MAEQFYSCMVDHLYHRLPIRKQRADADLLRTILWQFRGLWPVWRPVARWRDCAQPLSLVPATCLPTELVVHSLLPNPAKPFKDHPPWEIFHEQKECRWFKDHPAWTGFPWCPYKNGGSSTIIICGQCFCDIQRNVPTAYRPHRVNTFTHERGKKTGRWFKDHPAYTNFSWRVDCVQFWNVVCLSQSFDGWVGGYFVGERQW